MRKDRVGEKHGRLLIIEELESRNGRRWVMCLCDCGNKHEVRLSHVRTGRTKSCGCLLREWVTNQPKLSDSKNWKGGIRVDQGYVYIYRPDHPKSKSNGYVREHTIVMEEKLGRYLLPTENVHHKDGNKMNNKPDNLELWSTTQPSGQRVEDKVSWAKEILELYG